MLHAKNAQETARETFEERPIMPKYKEGNNFNRRNTRKYFED